MKWTDILLVKLNNKQHNTTQNFMDYNDNLNKVSFRVLLNDPHVAENTFASSTIQTTIVAPWILHQDFINSPNSQTV